MHAIRSPAYILCLCAICLGSEGLLGLLSPRDEQELGRKPIRNVWKRDKDPPWQTFFPFQQDAEQSQSSVETTLLEKW
jgi:hypothetical protein